MSRGPVKDFGALESGELPTGAAKVTAVREMFDAIAPRYDLLNSIISLGLDRRWRARAVAALALARGSRVVDLACGTGRLTEDLISMGYLPVGLDLSAGMLANARRRLAFVRADAAALPFRSESLDGATCGFGIRNFESPFAVFASVAQVVRPGGSVSFVDAARPANPLIRAGHGLYFDRLVPLIGGLLSSRAAYTYLPRSLAYVPDPGRLADDLQRAGFEEVRVTALSAGLVYLLTGRRGNWPGPATPS